MDDETKKKLDEQSAKIDAIYTSVEKTRKYFLFVLWASVIAFVLPLIAMMFVVPKVINTYMDSFEGLL